MVILGAIAALLVLLVGVLLWRTLKVIRSEVSKSVTSLDEAALAMGKVSLERERANQHIERVASLRIRRVVLSRLRRRLTPPRT